MLLSAMSGQIPGSTVDNPIRSVVLANMVAQCPLLNYAQFYSHTGNADEILLAPTDYNETLNTRAINAEFAEDTLNTPSYTTTGLKIFGFKAKSDLAWNAREPNGAMAHHGREIVKYAQAMGRNFFDRFINDTASGTQFDGLKALCTANSREFVFTSNGTDGEVLSAGDTSAEKKAAKKFIEFMNYVESEVTGSGTKVIIAPKAVANRLAAIGTSYLSFSTATDLLGQPKTVTSWGSIPIIESGKKGNMGQQVIDNAETVGATTDCTSVYIAIFNERDDLTFNTNVGLYVDGPRTTDNFLKTRAELQTGLSVVNPFSIARITGIRVTA